MPISLLSRLGRNVAIIGIGNSKFGKRDDVSVQELAWESIKEALNDTNHTQKDVSARIVIQFTSHLKSNVIIVVKAKWGG